MTDTQHSWSVALHREFKQRLTAPVPSALFHYTDQFGLCGIMSSRTIWATDIRFLNDEREFSYAVDFTRDYLRIRRQLTADAASLALLEGWDALLNREQRVRYFAACFSVQSDSLPQWRAYSAGGTGYALSLDVTTLAAIPGVTLVQCIYDSTEQHQLVEHLVSTLASRFHAEPSDGPKESEGLVFAYNVLFYRTFLMLAASFKNPGFREECEWRAVVRSESEHGDPPVLVRAGRRGLIPYIPLPIGPSDRPMGIHAVTVGPTPNRRSSCDAVWSLLKQYDVVTHRGVNESSISYRNW